MPPPGVNLPAGWVATGEYNGTGIGDDGLPDGLLLLGHVVSDISTAYFGIDQEPVAFNVSDIDYLPQSSYLVVVLNGNEIINTTKVIKQ